MSKRDAPLEMTPEEFRQAGHRMVDQIAEFLATIRERPVASGESPSQIQSALGLRSLPEEGEDINKALDESVELMFKHSLFNGHPKFWGYITSSAAPVGSLADMLASTVNPNLGGWILSPMACEIEKQTVQWIAELIGYPSNCGGILSSGGNMANFIGFLAGRKARAPWDVQAEGYATQNSKPLGVYVSKETHTWIEKASAMFGIGTNNVRWIETDETHRMNLAALRKQIAEDKQNGVYPILVVATGGSVGTGAVDQIGEIRKICDEHDLWLHIDGAYGALAAPVPGVPEDLKQLHLADSIATDPHKWLYASIEAGCTLVKDPKALRAAFSYKPTYYKTDDSSGEEPTFFYEYGPQNTRGFRALKVWLGLRQAGRKGYIQMIGDDIELAGYLFEICDKRPEIEAKTHGLSVTVFRFVPGDLEATGKERAEYLSKLNTEILTRIQEGGEIFISNVVIDDEYYLRSCIVNFRTTREDLDTVPPLVEKLGRELDAELRSVSFKTSG